jgi:hypothetical protein
MHYGPNIPANNNLLLFWDFANPKSYSIYDTVVFDLSGNNRSGSFSNDLTGPCGPTFTGVDDMIITCE